jgi:hypothetical protein
MTRRGRQALPGALFRGIQFRKQFGHDGFAVEAFALTDRFEALDDFMLFRCPYPGKQIGWWEDVVGSLAPAGLIYVISSSPWTGP